MPESRPFPQARQDLEIRTRTITHEKMRSRMQGSAGGESLHTQFTLSREET